MSDELDRYIDEMTGDSYGHYSEEDDPMAIEQAERDALEATKKAFGIA